MKTEFQLKREKVMKWWRDRTPIEQEFLRKLYKKGLTGREIESIYNEEHPIESKLKER